MLQLLSSFYREASDAGIIPDGYNPTKGIKHYKIEARQNFLSESEIEKIGIALQQDEEDGSENQFEIAAIRLLIYTVVRLNEILSLRWTWVNLRNPWERIKRKADIQPNGSFQHIRIHDIRHSYAALAASNGASLPIIGALLGHKQASTTQRYTHLANDPLKKANNQIRLRAEKALMKRS